jgi:hypothetical protein
MWLPHREALESVRDQTLRGVEVTSGRWSSDGTCGSERFAGEFDLVVMRQANAGLAARTPVRARGRYCALRRR